MSHEKANGHIPANERPITDWVIVITNGMRLLGLPKPAIDGGTVLSPVYEISVQAQPTPTGIAINHSGIPVLFLPSIDGIKVPDGAISIPVSRLSSGDRRACEIVAKSGDALATNMRAAEAGIALAPTNMKLPPPPSRA